VSDESGGYRAVLRLPHALRTFLPALVGRFAYALLPLSLLFTVQAATGSFTVAGLAVAAYGLASLLLPVKARLIDRRGQRLVVPILAAGAALPLALVAAMPDANAVLSVGCAVLAGVSAPPLGPAMRSTWRRITRGSTLTERAYALDSICEEALYLAGPLLVGVLMTVWAPRVALFSVAVLLVVGAWGMVQAPPAATERTEAPDGGRALRFDVGPLADPGLRVVVAAVFATAVGLSLTYTSVAATAAAQGRIGAAGYVEAAIGLGSVLGGFLWGRRKHPARRSAQFAGLIVPLACGMLVAALTTNLLVLGVVLAVAGLTIAPLFVVSYVAADALAAEYHRTEASTWVNTANNLGSAAGATIAGVLADHVHTRWGFLSAAALLVLAVGGIRLCRVTLNRDSVAANTE
jgi:MFS family permease